MEEDRVRLLAVARLHHPVDVARGGEERLAGRPFEERPVELEVHARRGRYTRPCYAGAVRKIGLVLMWTPALLLCAVAARYFLSPPPLLRPELPPELAGEPIARAVSGLAEHLYTHHRATLLAHVGAGIVALGGGLLQFVPALRRARPRLHRGAGWVYLAAVLVGGVTGVPLAFQLLGGVPEALRPVFSPSVVAFLTLSPAWVALSAMAFLRARQRRYGDHRAWMIRSYSLTFASVTARVLAPLFLALSGDPVLLANGGIVLWPLNLVVAEWLIRRPAPIRGRAIGTARAPGSAAPW